MENRVTIETVRGRSLLGLECRPGLCLSDTFRQLQGLMAAQGIDRPRAHALALYADLGAGKTIVAMNADPGDDINAPLRVVDLPGGQYATLVVEGSERRVAQARQWLLDKWLPASDYRLGDGPVIEDYLGGPDRVQRTQIRVPVQPRGKRASASVRKSAN